MNEMVITGILSCAKLQSNHHHQHTDTQMTFLLPKPKWQNVHPNLTSMSLWFKGLDVATETTIVLLTALFSHLVY